MVVVARDYSSFAPDLLLCSGDWSFM